MQSPAAAPQINERAVVNRMVTSVTLARLVSTCMLLGDGAYNFPP